MTLSRNPAYSLSPSPAKPVFRCLSDIRLSLLSRLTALVQALISSLDSAAASKLMSLSPTCRHTVALLSPHRLRPLSCLNPSRRSTPLSTTLVGCQTLHACLLFTSPAMSLKVLFCELKPGGIISNFFKAALRSSLSLCLE